MCGLSVAVYFDKNGEKLTVFHLNFHNDLNIHTSSSLVINLGQTFTWSLSFDIVGQIP